MISVCLWCAYIIVSGLLAIGVFLQLKLPVMVVALYPILGDSKLVCYLFLIGLFVMLVLFLRWAYLPWWRSIEQTKRNEVYEDYKFLMPLCFFAIGVGIWAQYCCRSSFVFWVETVMLIAFGVSWFVKGIHCYVMTITRNHPAGAVIVKKPRTTQRNSIETADCWDGTKAVTYNDIVVCSGGPPPLWSPAAHAAQCQYHQQS